MTIEERVFARFVEKLKADTAIPDTLVHRVEEMLKEAQPKDVSIILDLFKQEAKAHDKNTSP